VQRALVLGGGGITGIAWEVGMLKGLADAGVDVTGADVVVGTSAGSVVGAQVTYGLSVQQLYDSQLPTTDAELGGKFGLTVMLRMGTLMVLPGSSRTRRRRIGRAAMRATRKVRAGARTEMIRARLEVHSWPDRDLRITAVDVDSGELRVFDGSNDVDIVEAVAASCAVPLIWPPVKIDGHRYMDGGIRSTVNIDLAKGADSVVVLAPLPQTFGKYYSIPAQLDRLGPHVRSLVVSPDKQALKAIGRDMLDPTKRADAAHAGLVQAASVVDQAHAVWH
jgi:NTE family protein